MHSEKKITKEDTWRPADLKRHIREESDDYIGRQDVNERKHDGGESKEKHCRDQGKESKRERDKHREVERTRGRLDEVEKDKYVDQRRQGSWDTRGEKERARIHERDREKRKIKDRLVDEDKYSDDYRKTEDRRRDRDGKHEREKERIRDKEKERIKDIEGYKEEERNKRKEERDKVRRKEERGREHRTERRRHEQSVEGARDRTEKYDREKRDRYRERDRHKDEYEEKKTDKDKKERHRDRNPAERRDEREYKEEHTKHKERERKHKERGYNDEKRKHGSESREHQDLKGSDEAVRHHRRDRERAEEGKGKETRHKKEVNLGKKQMERRSRAEEEPEGNHKDRTSSTKPLLVKGHRHDTNTAETEPDIDEDYANQEYEDDFEDYEEDFEEIDESANEGEDEKDIELPQVEVERAELASHRRKEIEAIQRAMDEENKRVGTAQSGRSTNTEEADRPKSYRGSENIESGGSQRGKFIDFVAAKQREISKKAATKQKKRSTELLRLIDLDFSMTFSLLDLPPVNEYDLYIRNFGNANTKQAYVQCNEDNADRDIQTDEIEMCKKWTQHPPDHRGACGDPDLSREAQDKTISELYFDSQRLTAFLNTASQVMVVLLEEEQAERKSLRNLRTQTDTLSHSEGSVQLNTKLPFLYGRHISQVHFSQVQRHTMMSVHNPTMKPTAVRLDSCTIICIWNIWEPSRPQKILVYESEIQCCCFSPGKAILVFAGTAVGSVVLWDLREQASNHYHLKIGEDEWIFRQPTFSTDAVMANSGHFSPVISVEVVPSAVAGGLSPEVLLLESEDESSGLSFQLASLDEGGVLNFWVVVELPKANKAGSPTDLGLRPGSKVKLLHSSSLLTAERVLPRDAVKMGSMQTFQLKFLPTDSNHFFIGTNMGVVNHGTNHGLKAPPKCYRFWEAEDRPVDVTSIHFSPFKQNMFLVGCGDGSIRLHVVSHEQPVAEWKNSTAGEPVVSLQWAQTRPTVFCVFDAASNLHIWDLLKNETEPVVTERMNADRLTAMAVFGDSGKQNTYSGIALAHESGKIEIQYLTSNFALPISGEEEKLQSMMIEAF